MRGRAVRRKWWIPVIEQGFVKKFYWTHRNDFWPGNTFNSFQVIKERNANPIQQLFYIWNIFINWTPAPNIRGPIAHIKIVQNVSLVQAMC